RALSRDEPARFEAFEVSLRSCPRDSRSELSHGFFCAEGGLRRGAVKEQQFRRIHAGDRRLEEAAELVRELDVPHDQKEDTLWQSPLRCGKTPAVRELLSQLRLH